MAKAMIASSCDFRRAIRVKEHVEANAIAGGPAVPLLST
jgi:hypothetical protein